LYMYKKLLSELSTKASRRCEGKGGVGTLQQGKTYGGGDFKTCEDFGEKGK